MLRLCNQRLRPLVILLVLMTCNTSVWAAHIDLPGAEPVSAVTVHDHESSKDKHLTGNCDHCCHLSSHVLAMMPETLEPPQHLPQDPGLIKAAGFRNFHGDPPFIPPIH